MHRVDTSGTLYESVNGASGPGDELAISIGTSLQLFPEDARRLRNSDKLYRSTKITHSRGDGFSISLHPTFRTSQNKRSAGGFARAPLT